MPPEYTLETLAQNIADINVKLGSYKSDHLEHEKQKEAKKAQEEKEEEEKKEAKRAARIAAVKKAMEEDDDEKKDAALKKAMEDHDEPTKHDNPSEKNAKKAQEEEEKEKDEHVASIISDARKDFINKILTANSISNPTKLPEIEARLKKASFSDVKKEWSILAPMFEGATSQTSPPQEKFVPYFANITPQDVDASTLTASSPASEFSKFTTKELQEMNR